MSTRMPSMPPDPIHAPSQGQALRFALRGVRVLVFALVIATFLWALLPQAFGSTLVYSLSISLCCWLLVDSGRLGAVWLLQRGQPAGTAPISRWPGWPWMVAIVVVGSIGGYSLGNAFANAVTGIDSPGLFTASRRGLITVIVVALVPGIAITYFFKSRETLALQEARMLRSERQASEQQLHMLQAQLEPHMLFNTLANLRALIGVDPERAQAMLDRLIAFLRASLAGSRSGTQALAEEFDRLRDYLELMQVRMGARLATRFELPGELAGAQVPSMLLQPIVENSIRHGLEPRREGGRVDVRAGREGESLVIRIRDTGLGLGSAPPAPSEGGGFGLLHVRERLATLYGSTRSSFSLEAAGDAEGGTCAIVRLPLEFGSAAPDPGPAACETSQP